MLNWYIIREGAENIFQLIIKYVSIPLVAPNKDLWKKRVILVINYISFMTELHTENYQSIQ